MRIHTSSRILSITGIFVSLTALAGCGGGSGSILNQTTGNYSNASLKGSYVFQMRGFVSQTGNPYREVGVITADGNGNITGGVDDVTTVGAGSAVQSSATITGTYSVANDGTGDIALSSTALGTILGSAQVTFGVTLTSTSSAYLLEADTFADGSGTADLQDPTAIGTAPSGNFVFGIHQDTNGSASESQVGLFAITNGGMTGSEDESTISAVSSLTLTGTMGAPTNMGGGAGSFNDSSNVTTNFIYYVVNSGKFVLLVNNAGAIGSGSAEVQSPSVSGGLSGVYAFGARGDDASAGVAAVATVGQFTVSGGTISSGALDIMQDGTLDGGGNSPVTFTSSAAGTTSAQGREQITLSTGPTVVFWLVSSSRAFFVVEGAAVAEDGTADLQTGAPFSAGSVKGQYALVMDGIDVSPEAVARVGTLQFDGSSKITLDELVNDSGTLEGAQSPGALQGNYQVGGSGRITAQITDDNGGGPDMVMYAVSASQAYVLQNDPGENTSGTMQLQQ